MRKLSGVLGSYCRAGLGPTKRPGPMNYKREKGVYRNPNAIKQLENVSIVRFC